MFNTVDKKLNFPFFQENKLDSPLDVWQPIPVHTVPLSSEPVGLVLLFSNNQLAEFDKKKDKKQINLGSVHITGKYFCSPGNYCRF